jgi:hypothetical protein
LNLGDEKTGKSFNQTSAAEKQSLIAELDQRNPQTTDLLFYQSTKRLTIRLP